jgi:hypothetical protein
MLYALDPATGDRIGAQRGITATCPVCASAMIPKCGALVIHHWAHQAHHECDPWHEPETDWHRAWKGRFPGAWTEITIGTHRADVRHPSGLTIEFQHSAISTTEIAEREAFYGPRLVWVFDARAAAERFELRRDYGPVRGGSAHSFLWRRPRRSLVACQRSVWLDLGADGLFEICQAYFDERPGRCRGWGRHYRSVEVFLTWTRSGARRTA